MNFVIPMAGRGQRFLDAGFSKPKMLIETKGKTLLEWSVNSLPLEICSNLIFILLKEHEQKFGLINQIKSIYSKDNFKIKFLILEEVTRGQAETVIKSKHLWNLDEPLVIFNIDTQFLSTTLRDKLIDKEIDGVLGAFVDSSNTNRFSFASLNDNNVVDRVVEKDRISDFALTGMYAFRDPNDFIRVGLEAIKMNKRINNEFYVAPLYQTLINEGKVFILDYCEEINILGTPEELAIFNSSK